MSDVTLTLLAENQTKILKLRVNNILLAEEKEDLQEEITKLTWKKNNLLCASQDAYKQYATKRSPSMQLTYEATIIKMGLATLGIELIASITTQNSSGLIKNMPIDVHHKLLMGVLVGIVDL